MHTILVKEYLTFLISMIIILKLWKKIEERKKTSKCVTTKLL